MAAGILDAAARPTVLLTYAGSLDGSIAARRGAPFALSGRAAREMTHALRAAHDAILVGIGTVLTDNPQLNVRLATGPDPRPVVLDAQLRCPPRARCVDAERGTIIVTSPHAPEDRQLVLENAGALVLRVPSVPDDPVRLDLRAVLGILTAHGIRSLMVEGGAQIITAFLQGRLVDRVVLTISPTFIGGVRSVNALLAADNDFPRLRNLNVTQLGNDIIVQGDMDWDALE